MYTCINHFYSSVIRYLSRKMLRIAHRFTRTTEIRRGAVQLYGASCEFGGSLLDGQSNEIRVRPLTLTGAADDWALTSESPPPPSSSAAECGQCVIAANQTAIQSSIEERTKKDISYRDTVKVRICHHRGPNRADPWPLKTIITG